MPLYSTRAVPATTNTLTGYADAYVYRGADMTACTHTQAGSTWGQQIYAIRKQDRNLGGKLVRSRARLLTRTTRCQTNGIGVW